MPKPRLVLFDAVGTLLHPEPAVPEAYRAAGQRFGSRRDAATIPARFREALALYGNQDPAPDEQAAAYRRGPRARRPTDESHERQRWMQIVAHVFDDVPEHGREIFALLWEHFAHGQHWRLDPQLAGTWEQLEQRGYALGIASNFDCRLLTVCAAHPPLSRSQHIYFSSQLGFVKPDPRFYEAVEQRSGYRGPEILLVGDDRLHDYEGPRECGWRSVLLDPTGSAELAAGSRVAELSELLSIL